MNLMVCHVSVALASARLSLMCPPQNNKSSDIERWLQKIGLEDYIPVFASEEIDYEVLVELTDADLKEIGIPLGSRKKLLKAIAELHLRQLPTAELTQESAIFSSESSDAQRRQLTVMFCDLVGSTELSSRFDPEDLSDIVRSFQDCCASVVSQFDGYVARHMGDGMLVYFGYPRAHEYDSERALHAGLELIKSVHQLEPRADLRLQIRIGVATGLVVVGETIGEDSAKEQVVMGETPNLAARLQGIADPNQLVVSDATRKLCENVFNFQDLGERSLKGFTNPVATFAVLAERAIESRFDARQSKSLQAMIGREHELALILQRWQSALRGEGQAVVLSGEAGIGKSRITRAVVDTVARDEHFLIKFQCSPYHTDSALYPAIRQLHRAAGFDPDDSNETKLDKLESLLSLGKNNTLESSALIALLLGLDEKRYAKLELTPQQQRMRTLEALQRQLVSLAQRKPVLFMVEDAHWIDATTLEFIELCLDPITSAPILFIINARPGFEHSFGSHPVVTSLKLNRLGREQINGIIGYISRGKILPTELIDEIVDKTDGVPLFVEEFTKTVLESGALVETADAWILEGSLTQLAIPTSLHDSLMARLDRLNKVKDVAQMAACIGREFDYTLLATVSNLSDTELEAALNQLISAELVFRRGVHPNLQYSFKHALVRDAAYESLLKSVRQQLHSRIADALRESGAPPELLAHHTEYAGELEQAVEWWQKAGEAAFARPAFEESIGHLCSAIRLVQQLGDDMSWTRRELGLQVQLGQALIAKRGYSAKFTGETFNRALALNEVVDDSELRFQILYGSCAVAMISGELERALKRALSVLELADTQEESSTCLLANRIAGATHALLGDIVEARPRLEIAAQIYDPGQHRALANRLAHEPGAAVHANLALVLWCLGYPELATTHAESAVSAARESTYVSICHNEMNLGIYTLCRGDADMVRRHGVSLEQLADEYDMTQYRQFSEIYLGWASVALGDESGIQRFQRAIESYTDAGAFIYAPIFTTTFASQLLQLGRIQDARQTIEMARQIMYTTDERFIEAELLRVQGDIYLQSAEQAKASSCYQRAIETARKQSAKAWELRAATSFAELLGEQGEKQQARDLLDGVYSWFSEGLESQDMKRAGRLLDQLT